jgi:hypothetical protein
MEDKNKLEIILTNGKKIKSDSSKVYYENGGLASQEMNFLSDKLTILNYFRHTEVPLLISRDFSIKIIPRNSISYIEFYPSSK